jgi:hypothetical protein
MNMTAFDYVFPLLLVWSVVRQIRGKRLGWNTLAWPVGLVGWAAAKYLHGIGSASADIALVAGCGSAGLILGTLAGRFTHVYRADGRLIARATATTVGLWTVGAIGRLVFGLYAEHGGRPAIAAFSAVHGLHPQTWASALTLMALAEVLGRTVVLAAHLTLASGSTRPTKRANASRPECGGSHRIVAGRGCGDEARGRDTRVS